jgi:hypothetical protein
MMLPYIAPMSSEIATRSVGIGLMSIDPAPMSIDITTRSPDVWLMSIHFVPVSINMAIESILTGDEISDAVIVLVDIAVVRFATALLLIGLCLMSIGAKLKRL